MSEEPGNCILNSLPCFIRVTYIQNLCEPGRIHFAQIQNTNHESPKVRNHEGGTLKVFFVISCFRVFVIRIGLRLGRAVFHPWLILGTTDAHALPGGELTFRSAVSS